MTKKFLRDALLWGIGLWFVGYALGIIFFAFIPANLIGWIIMPIGIILTLWVLMKKIKSHTCCYYFGLAIIWTLIAMIFDYFFLVKVFHPINYYKLDVYLYYMLTLILPLIVGGIKAHGEK